MDISGKTHTSLYMATTIEYTRLKHSETSIGTLRRSHTMQNFGEYRDVNIWGCSAGAWRSKEDGEKRVIIRTNIVNGIDGDKMSV